MRFTAPRDDLSKAFAALGVVMQSRTVIPVLGTVKIEAAVGQITLATHNLDQCASATVAADVSELGSACIPFAPLHGLIAGSAKGSHVLIETADKAKITIGRSRYLLGVLPPEEFPSVLTPRDGRKFECDTPTFHSMVNAVQYAINPEDLRPTFANLIIDGTDNSLTMFGGNGHMGAIMREDFIPSFGRVLLSVDVVKDILSLTKSSEIISFDIDANIIAVSVGNIRYASKLTQAEVADFRRMFPQPSSDGYAILPREEILAALKRMRVILDISKLARAVKISWTDDGKLNLQIRGGEKQDQTGDETIECETVGTREVACNLIYLSDTIENMTDDKICICAGGLGDPIHVLAPSDPNRHAVIMPMRW